MAALMRHGLLKGGQGLKTLPVNAFMIFRCKSYVKKDKKSKEISGKTVIPPIKEDIERGYLRPHKDYYPPENVEEQFSGLCQSILGDEFDSRSPVSHEHKYELLNACFQEFNHSVPNGILHTIKSPDEILQFYKTEIVCTNPLDALKEQELPPNLHVQYEYLRFHPETDTMFGGISAFPHSSTIVTGLKSKKKYKGYKVKTWCT